MSIIGTIVRANLDGGYYWIRRDDGQPDVFLGDKQLQIDGLMPLKPGTRLAFDVKAHDRGHRAFNVSVWGG